jgi:Arf-GAP domain and FG repeat-containing protein 1
MHRTKAKSSSSSGPGSSSSSSEHDRHVLHLRELQSGLAENKLCFDCGQRGPTYVNMTVGAFVCTKCSGML